MIFTHPCILVPPDAVVPLAPECRDNSECPPHTACINRQCLNPCAVLDPCATNAYCRVQNHEPVCTCPPGYLGDPRVSCTKRKFHYCTVPNFIWCDATLLNLYVMYVCSAFLQSGPLKVNLMNKLLFIIKYLIFSN